VTITVTRKLKPSLTPSTARMEVVDLLEWQPVAPSAALLELAWDIEDRWQFSWWDSLIVAAAKISDCSTLLSEDLQDGLDIDGLRIVNPFSEEFSENTFSKYS